MPIFQPMNSALGLITGTMEQSFKKEPTREMSMNQ